MDLAGYIPLALDVAQTDQAVSRRYLGSDSWRPRLDNPRDTKYLFLGKISQYG